MYHKISTILGGGALPFGGGALSGSAGASSSYRDASWFFSAAIPSSVSMWAQEPSEIERGRATPYRISIGRPQT
jgi:hypothetical protein